MERLKRTLLLLMLGVVCDSSAAQKNAPVYEDFVEETLKNKFDELFSGYRKKRGTFSSDTAEKLASIVSAVDMSLNNVNMLNYVSRQGADALKVEVGQMKQMLESIAREIEEGSSDKSFTHKRSEVNKRAINNLILNITQKKDLIINVCKELTSEAIIKRNQEGKYAEEKALKKVEEQARMQKEREKFMRARMQKEKDEIQDLYKKFEPSPSQYAEEVAFKLLSSPHINPEQKKYILDAMSQLSKSDLSFSIPSGTRPGETYTVSAQQADTSYEVPVPVGKNEKNLEKREKYYHPVQLHNVYDRVDPSDPFYSITE